MHLAALDQHSGGSKPYQRENRQRGRPVRSLAVTWGRGPALGRRVVAVDAEANRFYGQVSILRLMNAELCRTVTFNFPLASSWDLAILR